MSAADPYLLDKRLMRRAFDDAAAAYDAVAVLQREIGQRLLERLDLIRLAPSRLIDIGCGTGLCTNALAERYRDARVIALDLAPSMVRAARAKTSWWQRWRGRYQFICGDAEALPIADASVDLIVSNLTLQWCTDLDRVFTEFRRILAPEGLVLFSTLGPDTLHELREAWRQADEANHVNAFIDMHDVGDALMRAGFADPVMDMEYMTVTYPDVFGLMRDLKQLGAHNVSAGRKRGLTGRAQLQRVVNAYEQWRRDGVLPATYEVVYGHAWTPVHQFGGERGVATVPVDQLRRSRKEVG